MKINYEKELNGLILENRTTEIIIDSIEKKLH